METDKPNPAFAPFIPACKQHGISKTVAYELAAKGMLETFTIGRARYVRTESLRTLPDRLAQAVQS